MDKTAIIINNINALPVAQLLNQELDAPVYSVAGYEGTQVIASLPVFLDEGFKEHQTIIFVGALGICVRAIAPYLESKQSDPAIINLDIHGRFIQPVVSGHKGGANAMAQRIARMTGGTPIVTTASDTLDLWALDIIGKSYDWTSEYENSTENQLIASFVNGAPTALVLETKDAGTHYLERTLPTHVELFYSMDEVDENQFEVIIAVTPRLHKVSTAALFFRPKCLVLGTGSQKGVNERYYSLAIADILKQLKLSPWCVKSIHSVGLKQGERAFTSAALLFGVPFITHPPAELNQVSDLLEPSEAALQATGAHNVSEAAALIGSGNHQLVIPKIKGVDEQGKHFTLAIAMDRAQAYNGQIYIVGAGPGDPELVSVKGKRLLEAADLILYAGSLVPEQLTHYAKSGCVVRNSAQMDLEEQFQTMREAWEKGHLVVRLHTGDPCIYGAIQEQMNFFDANGMSYEIVPGISSFQAAAARLQSQFTIPERIQTIILTRGEGRTPMPPRERLSELAKFQSTICLFLSVTLIDDMQAQLLEGYPPETPIAVCYKLTWKEEKIWRGQLKDLVTIVRENNLSLTVMIVVGEAIGNRENRSKLYDPKFTHLFRAGKA